MKYRLIIAAEAKEQLRNIAQWYAEQSQSLDVAAKWYDGFLEALDSLKTDPLRYALARENEHFPYNFGSCFTEAEGA